MLTIIIVLIAVLAGLSAVKAISELLNDRFGPIGRKAVWDAKTDRIVGLKARWLPRGLHWSPDGRRIVLAKNLAR